MASLADRIYQALPVWMQHVAVTGYGLLWKRRRFGGAFTSARRGFVERERWTHSEWTAHQTDRLRVLLQHAYRNVPHYRRALQGAASRDGCFASFGLADLPALPLLEKDTIRSQPERLIADSAGQLHTYLTSGTTGTPLAVRMSSATHQVWSAAYDARCRRWAGVHHGMSRAMIGGRIVVPRGQSRPPYHRHNWAERQIYLSAFHIGPETTPAYAEALSSFRPDYLVGYASAHFFLARFFQERGLHPCRPKAILTSSEPLAPEMRGTLEHVYGCRVFDAYSGVEACCLASECEYHRLHVSPDVGVVELLDPHGRPVPNGDLGEIVATGLLNQDQPLIRYRTGDWAALSDEPCPCGRGMPVLRELVGRIEDAVVGPDGREMVRFHGIFVGLPSVREGQVIQEAVDRFRLRVVVGPDFGEVERQTIRARFDQRLGPVHVDIEPVEAIERTERGKFRAVISRIPRAAGRGVTA